MSTLTSKQEADQSRSEVLDPPLTEGFLDLMRIAWRRKLLIALGLAVGIGLGGLAYALITPTYKSEAQLMVVRKHRRAMPIPGVDPQYAYMEDPISTHQAIIKSPLIVNQAIREAELESLESLKAAEDPARAVGAGLSVSRDAANMLERNNAILNLSYTCSIAEDAPVILNAVIDSYKKFMDRSRQRDTENMRTLFVQWKEEVQKQLAKSQQEYKDLRASIPPDHWKGDDGVNPAQQRLTGIRAERLTHLVHATEVREKLRAIETAQKEGVPPEVLVQLVDNWRARQEYTTKFWDELSNLILEEKSLRETYGPRHPAVRAIDERIKLTRQLHLGQIAVKNDTELLDPVSTYVESLKQELRVTEGLEQALAAIIDEETVRAKRTDEYSEDTAELREDIARVRQLQSEIVRQLQEFNLATDSESIEAQVLAMPNEGKLVIWRTPIVIFPLTAFFGLVLGCGLAALAEVLDKRFGTPDEIELSLGAPVLGHIPVHRPTRKIAKKARSGDSKLAPILWTYYAPKSVPAEAYRGIGVALSVNLSGKGGQVLQVTSPKVGDGKTTVAANLAISLAQSGKKTILIDADLRRPSVHEVFGLPTKTGLAKVLADKAELADATRPSGVAGLEVLPCGPPPSNPGELLLSSRFKELLAYVRDTYDFAVIDTSPVLAVSDPCAVAAAVDEVLLVVRNGKKNRPPAERSRKLLVSLGVSLQGVIINNIKPNEGFPEYDYRQYGYIAEYAAAPVDGDDDGDLVPSVTSNTEKA